MKIIFSPVLIFCYNRPNKLNNLINSIQNNFDYSKYKYYFFCDGAKTALDNTKIKKNLEIIKKFKVKNKIIIKKKKNYGLAKSIISGVSSVLKKNKFCIILEDDLVLEKSCLRFINHGLNRFYKDKSIGSISGYSYVHNSNISKSIKWFKLYRHCSWSWGTWRRVWKKIDWETKHLSKDHIREMYKQKKLFRAGNDIIPMLLAQKLNIINSWAVRFNYNCLKKDLFSISPRFSLVKNDGFGMSSTHTINFFKKESIIFKKNKFRNIQNFNSPKLDIELNNLIKDKHPDLKKLQVKIFTKKIFDKLFC